jgi:hypothetical protein
MKTRIGSLIGLLVVVVVVILIGGYWIIQVKSKEEAIAWAKRIPFPAVEGLEGEIEIRQFLEMEDFVPATNFAKTAAAPREGVDFASLYLT